MKSRLAILSAAVVAPFLLTACGEEAPQVLGSGNQLTGNDDGMMDGPATQGTLLAPPPVSPGSGVPVSPGGAANMPPPVSPGDPAQITPGIVPGAMGSAPPGAGTATPPPAGVTTDRPVPPMPPTAGAVPPAMPGTAVTPPATPVTTTPPTTPAVTPDPEPAAAACEAAWTVGSSGYVSAPGSGGTCWQGYAWASATPDGDSTITPDDFAACGGDCALCVSGTVAPTEDFSGVGILGFNIAQTASSDNADTTEVTGTVTVNVSNAGGSPLRVQLTGTSKEWCMDISGESGDVSISLSDFVTECWEGGDQVAYSGEPVEALLLLVPGSDTDATDFDICLNSVDPG